MTAENVAPPPRDNLTRAMAGGYDMEEGDGKTLTGQIARPGEWAEIDSRTEGHFMEVNAPGAFAKTFAENAHLRFLFQHGKDPELGDRPIAVPKELHEDGSYRAELLDGLPPMIVDGLRKRQYGTSHSFSVIREDWNPSPRASARNPDAIPERTIKEARVHEISVVTWPAYANATVGLRSMTDERLLDTLTEPPAPSADAGATPHLEPERREEPAVEPTPAPKESRTMEYLSRDEKAARIKELEDVTARMAVAYPGVLPAGPQAEWDAAWEEKGKLEADVKAWDERQAMIQRNASNPELTVPGAQQRDERPASFNVVRTRSDAEIHDIGEIRKLGAGDPDRTNQLYRDNAMRAVERMTFPHPQADPQQLRPHVAHLLDHVDSRDKELARRIITTDNVIYRRAFNKLLITSGNTLALTPEEQRAVMAVGVDATGGYSVPVAFDPTMVHIGAWTYKNPYRAACRVVSITGTDTWRGLTATAVSATRTTEAAASTDSSPTFGSPSYEVTRVQSAVVYSIEMDEDRPDLASEMASLIAEAKDTEEESIFSIGVGDALAPKVNPIGMFAAHGTAGRFRHKDSATDKTIAVGDIALAYNDVAIRYRQNAAWFMAQTTLQTFQGFETVGGRLFNSTLGYPAVGEINDNPGGNTGLRLLGKPVWEVPSAPAGLTTDDSPIAAFGDPKQYVIVDRIGMQVELIPHFLDAGTGFPTGQRILYAVWRNTAKPFNVDGMTLLTVF